MESNQIKSSLSTAASTLQRKVLQSKCVLSRQNIIDCDEADDCTSEILKKHVTIRPIDHKRQGRHAARDHRRSRLVYQRLSMCRMWHLVQ